MKDLFDEWSKQMGKAWAPWQDLMGSQDWLKGGPALQEKWGSWMAALRSGYDVNCGWWQTFMDQTEEVFYRAFKESPFYSQAAEDQMREFGASIKKAQASQKQAVKDYLDKMESLLRDKEGKS